MKEAFERMFNAEYELRRSLVYAGLCAGAAKAMDAARAHLPPGHPAMMAMLDVLLNFRVETAQEMVTYDKFKDESDHQG